MSNPLRLREMQERNGIKPKKSKEEKRREKELRKKLKHERKHGRNRDSRSPSGRHLEHRRSLSYDNHARSRRSPSPSDHRSRSPSPTYRYSRDNMRTSRFEDRPQRRVARSRSRSRTPEGHHHPRNTIGSRGRVEPRPTPWPRSDESDDNPIDRHPRRHGDGKRQRSRSPYYNSSPRSKRVRVSRSPPPARPFFSAEPPRHNTTNNDREARLAAMSSNASSMSAERQERLAAMLEKEKAELAAEEEARAKSKGMGGFLSHEQKKVFGGSGDLEERIRRGRGGMVVDND
jgi:hypothetical protein